MLDFGLFVFIDFQNVKQVIVVGEVVVIVVLLRLWCFVFMLEQYVVYWFVYVQLLLLLIWIMCIDIKISGGVLKWVVSNVLYVKFGDIYDLQIVSQDLFGFMMGGNFESVMQQIVSCGDDNVFEIDVCEKYWGFNFLLFGFGMLSSLIDEGGFCLYVGYWWLWFMELGFEFCVDMMIGSDLQLVCVELCQLLLVVYGVYLLLYVEYQCCYVNLYDNSNDVKLNQYLMQMVCVGFDFGLLIGCFGDFWIGFGYVIGYGLLNYNLLFLVDDGSSLMLLWLSFMLQVFIVCVWFVIDQFDDLMFLCYGYYIEFCVECLLLLYNS